MITALQIANKVLNSIPQNETIAIKALENKCFDLVMSDWDKANNAAKILKCIITLDRRFILIGQGWHRLTDWVVAWQGVKTQMLLAYLLGVV